MKEFFSDLFYMCSSSNQKSRGFYIGVTVLMFLMAILMLVSAVLLVINLVKGFFSPLFAILFGVALVIFIAVIVWLKKS